MLIDETYELTEGISSKRIRKIMKKFKIVKAKHLRLGNRGEKIACRFLKNKYYDILAKNFKSKNGEIDIVARDGSTICFIEVKTRRYALEKTYTTETWLTKKQSKRIQKASKDYLFELGKPKIFYRYELIEILLTPFQIKRMYHWQTNFGMRN